MMMLEVSKYICAADVLGDYEHLRELRSDRLRATGICRRPSEFPAICAIMTTCEEYQNARVGPNGAGRIFDHRRRL